MRWFFLGFWFVVTAGIGMIGKNVYDGFATGAQG